MKHPINIVKHVYLDERQKENEPLGDGLEL